jgi:hypothetical protein
MIRRLRGQSHIHLVAVATILSFLYLWQPSPAGATDTITDAEARCGAAVKAETWPEAADDCSGLVRNLSDILTTESGLSRADRLGLEEATVTFAAVTAHAYAELGYLKDAKLYILVATKELEIATSYGLSIDSDRYRELERAIDKAKAELPTK